MQLFDMCSYDMDSFREFCSMFDVPDTELAELILEDDRLLLFAMRFLRQVLFGEHTIPFKQGARERRIAERKEEWEQRRARDIERYRERESMGEDEG